MIEEWSLIGSGRYIKEVPLYGLLLCSRIEETGDVCIVIVVWKFIEDTAVAGGQFTGVPVGPVTQQVKSSASFITGNGDDPRTLIFSEYALGEKKQSTSKAESSLRSKYLNQKEKSKKEKRELSEIKEIKNKNHSEHENGGQEQSEQFYDR